MNSPASNLTDGIPAAIPLNSVQFSGSATTNYVSGVDSVVMTTGSGNATASGNSSVLHLGSAWNTAEFGIFGDGGYLQSRERIERPNDRAQWHDLGADLRV
jgi:hypothetical protein